MSASLKPFNTFGIQAKASQIVIAETIQQLKEAWSETVAKNIPALILGEGSNILFLEDYSGTVIINRISGIEVTEQDDAWYLHVGAGENWHRLVEYTLQQGMPGLENLALIPGCAGSSPIQNIGAYGVELKSVCHYVDCVDLLSGEMHRLTNSQCQFGYRDSIFKHAYQDHYAIVAVGLRLAKVWQPVLTYGDLTGLEAEKVTPLEVFNAVCHMRSTKLPDPRINGNAGSFFKNPVVAAEQAEALLATFATLPHYPQADGSVKLAAGWLIDRCQLKGYQVGGAGVHQQQALVLVNVNNASSQDIVDLAHHVRQCVGKKFNVWLEPEVRFIGAKGEVSAVETIA
ncbi:UDP-N-acetylmuramate dehydrogenase [Buttiauxella warmboldiae]|uniref:UDP-N-acetylenolpyruvoylglucosamine reductase n=1 Tax=Buttiauxella warmboldiae TaxID=82993 RepID=A0A3N5D1H1_9ENTR|nr:UDP-N-acetylmuramate dehydrogenase [Buttiauxella warmboldiae]RPH20308.1 UDP-N-acetylmuramate dehydrogenase [Buttiauxella warmboldiae]